MKQQETAINGKKQGEIARNGYNIEKRQKTEKKARNRKKLPFPTFLHSNIWQETARKKKRKETERNGNKRQ